MVGTYRAPQNQNWDSAEALQKPGEGDMIPIVIDATKPDATKEEAAAAGGCC